MSYVVRFAEKAIQAAEEKNASSVLSISVSVGEMTGVLPEYLYRYYPKVVGGTILEGSELKVTMIPVSTECGGCGKVYRPTRENRYLCPYCGDGIGRVVAGREVTLDSVEMEVAD
ncbi:MAG: hydrogenase maturation nickel metallochaperone HypA [Eubacterium sp.]|nr:hydrogenase maturation nickel metallochaperone HypA [Eubacterium sp.]